MYVLLLFWPLILLALILFLLPFSHLASCFNALVAVAVKEEEEEEPAAADEVKTEKIITATKKGAAVLDQWLPDHIKANYHVLQQASPLLSTSCSR